MCPAQLSAQLGKEQQMYGWAAVRDRAASHTTRACQCIAPLLLRGGCRGSQLNLQSQMINSRLAMKRCLGRAPGISNPWHAQDKCKMARALRAPRHFIW